MSPPKEANKLICFTYIFMSRIVHVNFRVNGFIIASFKEHLLLLCLSVYGRPNFLNPVKNIKKGLGLWLSERALALGEALSLIFSWKKIEE